MSENVNSEDCGETPNRALSNRIYSQRDFNTWVQGEIKSGVKVSMEDFATNFGFNTEESADPFYQSAIKSTEIPIATRQSLMDQYIIWRGIHGKEYWASRKSMHQIHVSTKKAVGEIVE
ncbi:hypothetical protein BGZ76_006779, partial [Entomortierella beljakovae]